jgi:hypothetical protein
MKTTKKFAAAAAFAVIAVLATGGVASADDLDSPEGTSIAAAAEQVPAVGEEVRFGRTLEDSVHLGYSGDAPAASRSIPFNPVDSLQCDVLNNANHELVTMYTLPYDNGST